MDYLGMIDPVTGVSMYPGEFEDPRRKADIERLLREHPGYHNIRVGISPPTPPNTSKPSPEASARIRDMLGLKTDSVSDSGPDMAEKKSNFIPLALGAAAAYFALK